MNKKNELKIAYLAISEQFDAKHAGFVHTYNIVNELSKLVKVSLFINAKISSTDENFRIIDVSALRIKNLFRNPTAFLKKFSEIKTKLAEFDIIHERFSVNPITYFLISKNVAKYFLEMNDPGIETWQGIKRIIYAPLIKLKMQRCDVIITQTETLKKIILKHTKKPIFVISNGANLNEFDIANRTIGKERKKFVKKNELLVTFVGSFREWHGVLDIPYIAEKVIEKNNAVKFLLVGNGKEFEKVKQLILEKNMTNNVFLVGDVVHEKIPLLLKASDICIAPFNTKNFPQLKKHGFWWSPIKLYEYLAAEKPVVSYDFEEIEKITANSGILAKKNNVKDFINAIIMLVENRNLRKELSNNARNIIRKHSWKNKAIAIINAYDSSEK